MANAGKRTQVTVRDACGTSGCSEIAVWTVFRDGDGEETNRVWDCPKGHKGDLRNPDYEPTLD